MFGLLKPGGFIVSVVGEGSFFHGSQEAQDFRAWLDALGAEVEKLPAGTFNDPALLARTNANARLVVIRKA